MRLRDRKSFSKPEIMIIPMIDIMFFLLVFFMISTLYMGNVKTVDVDIPKVERADPSVNVSYLVSMKRDGSLWLENNSITEEDLLKRAANENKINSKFSIVLRADQSIDYGLVLSLLDKFRGIGVNHFGLAVETQRQ